MKMANYENRKYVDIKYVSRAVSGFDEPAAPRHYANRWPKKRQMELLLRHFTAVE